MRVLVVGAGLSGLAAAERLLDAGARVTVIDAFPVAGGRASSFEVATPVAGLVPGDVVEHGLHAWFQHYHALFGLMERAGLPKPAFTGPGLSLWNPERGHYTIEGGPLFWLINALRLPPELRGDRATALAAFARLITALPDALDAPGQTDQKSALALLREHHVPAEAIDAVFRPCMFSLTSLPLEELSAHQLLLWMSSILPDPRIRCLPGGSTRHMAAPIAEALRARGADVRLGVEVTRMSLDGNQRVQLTLAQAPDRTGVRHVLVPGFRPAEPPDPSRFDAIVCTLPWERLHALVRDDAGFARVDALATLGELRNVHPLTVRLWLERPLEDVPPHYVLASGTVFDVVRPTPEPARGSGIHLIDALIENCDTHLPGFRYQGERYLDEPEGERAIERRVLADLERMYPGQIRENRVLRRFLHTREGIVACRPGSWRLRPPQWIGMPDFVLAGDYTRQPFGVCMEGAVRSGQLAADSLLAGTQASWDRRPFGQVAYSLKSIWQRR